MESREGNFGVLITGIIIGIIVAKMFWPTQYEGEGPEYWFNMYDESVGCLEDVYNTASYYSYGESYEDMQAALEEVESSSYSCL